MHNTEIRLLNIPDSDNEDIIFTFKFNIDNTKKIPDVTFNLILNQDLRVGTEESPPRSDNNFVYTLGKEGLCRLYHVTDEGYFVKGIVKLIQLGNRAGQFCDNQYNFLLDLDYGIKGNTPYRMEGAFALINPLE